MRGGALARRRGGAAPTFFSTTSGSSFTRPLLSGGATRLVPFTTKAQLDAAVSGMAAGDYIFYNGTGVLTISTTTLENAYQLVSKNPSSVVAFDFGVAHSSWGVATTGNYVHFDNSKTSAAGNSAFAILACSNIAVYGGEYTSTSTGFAMRGALSHVYVIDAWVHDVAATGVSMIPSTDSGALASMDSCVIRAEVGPNFCMNPALDTHADRGSGIHGCLLFDAANASTYTNNTVAIYAHDSLQPGASSYGQTWPEGAGGSVIEIGQTPSATASGNKIYARGDNMGMIPNGTNPGSTGSQTGGNVVNFWGASPLTGMVLGWVEGNTITGSCVQTDGASGWHSVAITVSHGRGTNRNLSHAGGNQTVPYPTISNVTYNDCV